MKGTCLMKKILLLLITIMLCFSLCSCDMLLKKAKSYVTGEEISEMPDDYVATLENDKYVYELYESYVKIMEYKADETEVTIPSEIDGKPVTVIGTLCFFETAITSVIIPSTVETIEGSAFYYADELTSIEIPDTIRSIGTRAFGWCNSLSEVKLGKGISEIPDYCFNHCAALVSIDIPDNITKIGTRAFSYCELLSDQIIPTSVESIGERAFASCPKLEYVTFENNSVSLGNALFNETDDVTIIAEEGSSVYNYCVENGLRWSTSKAAEAIKFEKSEESVDISEESVSSDIVSE